MNFRRIGKLSIFLGMALALAMTASLALADNFDEATRLTFDQPVAIPGQVLNPGTYWFVLAAHGSIPGVMQVFDGDRKNVLATFNVGTVELPKASGHIILTMADRSPKYPPALLDLTYPGNTNGRSFEVVYPAEERKPLSEYAKVTMKVGEKGVTERVEK